MVSLLVAMSYRKCCWDPCFKEYKTFCEDWCKISVQELVLVTYLIPFGASNLWSTTKIEWNFSPISHGKKVLHHPSLIHQRGFRSGTTTTATTTTTTTTTSSQWKEQRNLAVLQPSYFKYLNDAIRMLKCT